jgi:ATP-binding cassette, subfamily F, member 2
VSDASKKKAAQKKAAAAAKRGGKSASATSSSSSNGVNKVSDGVAALKLSDRTCTGVLASHPLSRDIHVCFILP